MGYEKGEVIELDNGEKFQVIEKVDRKILTRKLYTKDFSIYYVSSGPKGYETFAKCDFSEDERLLNEFMNKLKGSNKDVEKLAFRTICEALKEMNKKEKPTNEVAQLIEKYSKPKKDNKQTLKEEKCANKNIIKSDNKKLEKENTYREDIEINTKEKNIVKESAPNTREYYKLKLNNGKILVHGRYSDIIADGYINILPSESDSFKTDSDLESYNGISYVYAYKEGDHFRDILLNERIVVDNEGLNRMGSYQSYENVDLERLRKAVYPYLSCFAYSVCSNVEILNFLKKVEDDRLIMKKYISELQYAKDKPLAKSILERREALKKEKDDREFDAAKRIDSYIRNRRL